MRIPYAPTTPPATAPPSTQEIYTAIAARRSPRPLIPLDLALLHNPSIASGWNSLLGALRTSTSLPPALMELAVCRIAVLNGAVWEWTAHAPLALKGGLSRSALEMCLSAEVVPQGGREKKEGKEECWGEREWVVIRLTDQMTRGVVVDEGVFEEVKGLFGEVGAMELTAVIAGYNCVSRFLVALDVGEKNGLEMVMPPVE